MFKLKSEMFKLKTSISMRRLRERKVPESEYSPEP